MRALLATHVPTGLLIAADPPSPAQFPTRLVSHCAAVPVPARLNSLGRWMHSVLLVDDHPVWRDALAQLIESSGDFEVTHRAGSCDEARAVLGRHTFDLVVLDLSLPDGNGLSLVPDIQRALPGSPVVVVTAETSVSAAVRSLDAGASGFLPKTIGSGDLRGHLRDVMSGSLALDGAMAVEVLNRRRVEATEQDMGEREIRVLELMCRGVTSTQDLCAELHLSERSVKATLSGLYVKLGVLDRAAAVAAAFREGLVDPVTLTYRES